MKEITRIRRMVVTIAIRLKKMGLTLSAAFPSLTLKKRKNSLYIAQWCRLQAVEI